MNPNPDSAEPLLPVSGTRRRRWLGSAAAIAATPALGWLSGCAPMSPMAPAAAVPAPLPRGRSSSASLSPADLALVNRVSWGASPATAAQFARIGRDAWLESQLQLQSAARADLPPAVQAMVDGYSISASPFEQLVRQMDERRREADAKAKEAADPADKQAARQAYQQALTQVAREAASRSLLRAIYAPNQLQEQLTWFWFNHFNVHQYKANLRVMVGDYEDQALRPRALGRFRDLLIASATHPAMIRYLDNEQNAAGRINENYAREVMELHTLGVGGGYSQKDVQELARVLTGLGVNVTDKTPNLRPNQQSLYVRRGYTEFNPNRHDMGEKLVLGRAVAGRGWSEVLDELGRLAAQPATARHVSRRLAMHFAADTPPPALVERMAEAFTKSDGDIAVVMRTMFAAPEFAPTLGRKFKDPMRYVVSAVRLAYDERPIQNTGPLFAWLGRLGELPYNRQTPDGYPLDQSAWAGPGQMAARFEIARAIGSGSAGLFRKEGATTDAPAFPRLANAFFYESIEPTLGAATRAALDQAASPQEWNSFLLSSPEFMLR